jgi:hypothetical protein
VRQHLAKVFGVGPLAGGDHAFSVMRTGAVSMYPTRLTVVRPLAQGTLTRRHAPPGNAHTPQMVQRWRARALTIDPVEFARGG